ncbi:MAG TPA: hypothetical protein VGK56_00280, partial [Anaerolineales bacterium]
MEHRANRFFELFEKGSPLFWIGVGIISIGLIGFVDYLTGNEVAFSLFYLVPIALATLALGRRAGLIMSFIGAVTLLAAEIAAGQNYSHPFAYLLNTLIRTLFYGVVAYLIGELQKSRKEEQLAARTDFTTGAINARYFNELLQMEITR